MLLHRQELQVSLIRCTAEGSILFDIRPLGTIYLCSGLWQWQIAGVFLVHNEYKTAGFFSPYCK